MVGGEDVEGGILTQNCTKENKKKREEKSSDSFPPVLQRLSVCRDTAEQRLGLC